MKAFKGPICLLFIIFALLQVAHGKSCGKAFSALKFPEVAKSLNIVKEKHVTRVRAELILGRQISERLLDKIFRSHLVGLGEAGAEAWRPAGVGNYTSAHIRQKMEILKEQTDSESTLTALEIRNLFEAGVVGFGNTNTPAATVAAAATRGNSGYKAPLSTYDLIIRKAPLREVEAAFLEEKKYLEHLVRTGAGGSPEWHLADITQLYSHYAARYKESGRHD